MQKQTRDKLVMTKKEKEAIRKNLIKLYWLCILTDLMILESMILEILHEEVS
jgi:hypothetical protein